MSWAPALAVRWAHLGPQYEIEDRGYRTPCWIWQRTVDPAGYPYITKDRRKQLAHRVFYETQIGSIPPGLTLDHLCRQRDCVNPDHLEPVTMRENVLRGDTHAARNAGKTHCKHGHPFAGDNLHVTPSGYRVCRECKRVECRRRRARQVPRSIDFPGAEDHGRQGGAA